MAQFGYLTWVMLIFIWAVRAYNLFKDPILLYSLPLLSLWIIHNFYSFGYIPILFENYEFKYLAVIFRFVVLSLSLSVFLFHRNMILQHQPSRHLMLLIDSQIFYIMLMYLIFFAYDRSIALKMNAYFLAVSPILFLITSISAKKDSLVGLRTVRVFFTVVSFMNIFWVARLVGLNMDYVKFQSNALLYGIFSTILMFHVLAKYSKEASRLVKIDKERISHLKQRELVELEKNKTLIGFFDMLTHETKNALSIISINVSSMHLDADKRKRVDRAISDLNKVIERCNQSARLPSIYEKIEVHSCDILSILEDICVNQQERSRISIHSVSQPFIMGDQIFLKVIFSNLLENALKYSPADSKVNIALEEQKGAAVLVFENEMGEAGIPDAEKVFQRLYRNAKVHGKSGSGLGLHICDSLVRAHYGSIRFESVDGRIRFIVSFPCII
ncbi:hypothetical protein MCRY_18570 [Marivita cryptomonadis]|nr:hypothetical protein MCRY_18570 [Marivita cryptomonadis]